MAHAEVPDRPSDHESLSYLEFYKGLVVRHRQNQLQAGMVLYSLYSEQAVKLLRLHRQDGVASDKAQWVCAEAATDFKLETLLPVYELIRCPIWDHSFE